MDRISGFSLLMISKEALKKVDARGRFQLEGKEDPGEMEVLIRTEGTVSGAQIEELLAAGCNPRSIAGNVLSGTISDAPSLEKVAALPFVRRIELSRILFPEE